MIPRSKLSAQLEDLNIEPIQRPIPNTTEHGRFFIPQADGKKYGIKPQNLTLTEQGILLHVCRADQQDALQKDYINWRYEAMRRLKAKTPIAVPQIVEYIRDELLIVTYLPSFGGRQDLLLDRVNFTDSSVIATVALNFLQDLAQMHQVGVYNSDIKGENLLLMDNYNIGWFDHNQSVVLGSKRPDYYYFGTSSHLDPRIIEYEFLQPIDTTKFKPKDWQHFAMLMRQKDIFAAGITLMEFLLGSDKFYQLASALPNFFWESNKTITEVQEFFDAAKVEVDLTNPLQQEIYTLAHKLCLSQQPITDLEEVKESIEKIASYIR